MQNESSQNAVVDSTDQDVLDGTRTLSIGQLLGLFLNEPWDGRVFIDELIENGNSAKSGLLQFYVALSRVRKSSGVLLLHHEDENPIRCRRVHEMPMAVGNPTLKEAIDFVDGRARF